MDVDELLGITARDASLEDLKFVIVPHRVNDSKDTEEDWVWKLQTWSTDLDGKLIIISSKLL